MACITCGPCVTAMVMMRGCVLRCRHARTHHIITIHIIVKLIGALT